MKYNIDVLKQDDSLPQSLTDFLNYLDVIRGKSPNTIEAYKTDIIMFFRFMKLYKGCVPDGTEFESIKISDIDPDFIRNIKLRDMYAFLSFTEKYRNNGNYARARKVATLKSFYKYLYGKSKIISENPAAELETPKINKRNPIYLTLSESRNLLHSMNKKDKNYFRDYCILTIFLNCGLRVSELCSINIDKIKEDTMTIIGKGNKERTVYLNNACLRSIDEYLKVRDISKVPENEKKYLFISNKNRKISVRSVERLVKKYTLEAGLTKNKYTPHKLRHTAATLMYKHGNVDIRSLQQILGHESVSTTQIYTHVDSESLREAVKSNPLSDE